MGKEYTVPRWQQSYLKDYWFSGKMHKGKKIPDIFVPIFDWGNNLQEGITYNQMFVNWYKDGSHYIGAHSDNEKDLVKNSPILSISLGETRVFRIRDKKTNKIIKDISLINGSYIIMGGNMQENYTHEIVKVAGNKGKNMKKRINITFRQFTK